MSPINGLMKLRNDITFGFATSGRYCVLLQVEQSKVLIRAWKNRRFGGVRGGVAIASKEIAVDGADGGRDEANMKR